MKKTFKIIGLVVSFVGFMALGYFMPTKVYDPVLKVLNGDKMNDQNISYQTHSKPVLPPENGNIAANTDNVPAIQEPMRDSIVVDSVATTVVEVAQVSGMPKNVKAFVGNRSTKNYKKLGLPLTVTAEVETDAELECLVKLSEASTDYVAKTTFKNGKAVFGNIPPVDGGAYYICVRNTVSGESAGILQKGFDKIAKWSKEELTQQLNAVNVDKYFYFHFDMDKVKFDCEGIADGEKPTTIERLRVVCSALGRTMTVSETPKYDKYNRIVYFKIQIAE